MMWINRSVGALCFPDGSRPLRRVKEGRRKMNTQVKAVLIVGACVAGAAALRQIAQSSGARAGLTPGEMAVIAALTTMLVVPPVTRALRSR